MFFRQYDLACLSPCSDVADIIGGYGAWIALA